MNGELVTISHKVVVTDLKSVIIYRLPAVTEENYRNLYAGNLSWLTMKFGVSSQR